VPSLRKLSLIDVHITNKPSRMLIPHRPSNPNFPNDLLPNLNMFEYSGDLRLDLDMPILLDFMESRWERAQSNRGLHQITCLESVKFCMKGFGPLDPHSLVRLQHLVKEGMKINLSIYCTRSTIVTTEVVRIVAVKHNDSMVIQVGDSTTQNIA
jgi:hypothetical protein